MRVILASASPRRKELLAKLFGKFDIMPAAGEEHCTKTEPNEIVMELSGQKAAEIEKTVIRTNKQTNRQTLKETDGEYLIIGADTVVVWKGRILGKPKNDEDARTTLQMLAGNVHQVYTGVTCIMVKDGKRDDIQFAECTNVRFYPVSAAEIEAYVRCGEPMDKAGSYGIQGKGGRFIEGIEGDYDNVVGLPVAKLYQTLKNRCSEVMDNIKMEECGR